MSKIGDVRVKIRVKVGDVEIEVDDRRDEANFSVLSTSDENSLPRKNAMSAIKEIAEKASEINSEQYR